MYTRNGATDELGTKLWTSS